MSPDLPALVATAIAARAPLIAALHAEDTDCYRLFHGAVEGCPGLAVDRYGPLLLVQTFRDPLADGALDAIAAAVEGALGLGLTPAWRHRGAGEPVAVGPRDPVVARELGLAYEIVAVHRGLDPWLFLDLRCGRRWTRANAAGRDVLNLFAYTCGLGLAAAAGGAREVWNVDFAEGALAVGQRNAERNGLLFAAFRAVQADVLPTLRQLAGQGVKGRARHHRRFRAFEPRAFDLVILDPPTWATSPFGAVDLVRDYPALMKPALLATRPGGQVLATNHVSTVSLEDWLCVLRRCADKAGRPLQDLAVLTPEADFPSPDGRPPLKVAVATL